MTSGSRSGTGGGLMEARALFFATTGAASFNTAAVGLAQLIEELAEIRVATS